MPYELPVIGLGRSVVGGLRSIRDEWGAPTRARAAVKEVETRKERERQAAESRDNQTRLENREDAQAGRLPGQAQALQKITDWGQNQENLRQHGTMTLQTGLAGQLLDKSVQGRIDELGAGSKARMNEASLAGEITNRQLQGKLDSLLKLNVGLGGMETGQLGMFVGSDPNNPALKQINDNAINMQRNYLDSAERIARLSRPGAVQQGMGLVKDLGFALLASRF
jgi:hypothetical protein